MSRSLIARIRGVAVAGLAVLLVAGCGSPTGPSDDKARLDLAERMTRSTRGMVKLDDFRVAERRVLSEDRLKLHVNAGFTKDKERMRQIKERNRVMGGWSPALEQVEKADAGRSKATLTYKRVGDERWQLYRVQAGYQ